MERVKGVYAGFRGNIGEYYYFKENGKTWREKRAPKNKVKDEEEENLVRLDAYGKKIVSKGERQKGKRGKGELF